jgi:gamma-glutamyltranspeptidase/glutathione hydrolase
MTSAALRPIVMTTGGIVVAGHHLAAEAGAEVLREGGNAMDAAVAAAAALAVAIPPMNGIGGDAIVLHFERKSGKVTTINGSGAAPGKASVEAYRARGLSGVPQRGPLSISVPGAVHAWKTALERFGTISLERALQRAIAIAEHGLPLDRYLADFLDSALYRQLAAESPSLPAIYGAPAPRSLGSLVKFPALAATLRRIAAEGVGALYGGPVGRALIAELDRQGCLIALEDLARHDTRLDPALSVGYRGHRVHAAPPNSQGMALLMILGMLESEAPRREPADGAFLRRFLAMKRLAFAWRDRLNGDPALAKLPGDLLEPKRLAALAEQARHGDHTVAPLLEAASGDTSTLVTMDREGNAVSWVQSLFQAFGSAVASPETGIVMHNRLALARLDGDGPNRLRPHHRAFHTLAPALVTAEGRCRLAIATPGDHGQPQSLAQVIVNLVERGMDIQQAIEAPRVRHNGAAELVYETRLPDAALAPLREAGYQLQDVGPWSRVMGGINAIDCPDGTVRMGGADPRRASYAIPA